MVKKWRLARSVLSRSATGAAPALLIFAVMLSGLMMALADMASGRGVELRQLEYRPRSTSEFARQCEVSLASRAQSVPVTSPDAGHILYESYSLDTKDIGNKQLLSRNFKLSDSMRAWLNSYWYAYAWIENHDLEARTLTLRLAIHGLGIPAEVSPPNGLRVYYLLNVDSGGQSSVELDPALLSGFNQVAWLTIGLQGQPSEYPLDRYIARIKASTLRVTDGNGRESRFPVDLLQPIALEGSASVKVLPGFSISLPEEDATCSAPAVFILDRRSDLWYLVPVLLLPLVLVLALTHRRGPREGVSIIETSVALLALLTLRAVLVPSGITQVTFVDKFLALEVALLVAVVAFTGTRERPEEMVSDREVSTSRITEVPRREPAPAASNTCRESRDEALPCKSTVLWNKQRRHQIPRPIFRRHQSLVRLSVRRSSLTRGSPL